MDRKKKNCLTAGKIFFTSVLLGLVLSFSAQVKHSAKFKHTFNLAEKNFEFGYYKDALDNYMKIYAEDSNDVQLNYKIALCHYYEKHYPDSILPYLVHDDNTDLPEVQFLLGKLYHLKRDFEKAQVHFKRYKNFPADKREVNDTEVERLIEISWRASEAIQHPHKGIIVNLGKKVNTKYNEYVPVILSDESIMYFTSRRPGSTGNLKDAAGNYYEDIYFTTKKSGEWTEPQNVGAPVNSNDHDACISITPDGRVMLMYRPSKDKTSGDIYETHLEDDKWTTPAKLEEHINTADGNETSACISSDGSKLFFSSDKAGGFGGKDIYCCKLLPNGRWGLPMNMGPTINSAYDEDAPFISAAGNVLYFSSKGHSTIGEYDVFKTEFNTDETAWTVPENLGYPVNSPGDDIFFVINENGHHGYYSSQKDNGFGGEDLYMIDMRYNENEVKVKSGYIYESGSKEQVPVKAKITMVDNETKQQIGYYTSNIRNGKFILMVSPFRNYTLNVEAEGYKPLKIDVAELTPENEMMELKIELTKK